MIFYLFTTFMNLSNHMCQTPEIWHSSNTVAIQVASSAHEEASTAQEVVRTSAIQQHARQAAALIKHHTWQKANTRPLLPEHHSTTTRAQHFRRLRERTGFVLFVTRDLLPPHCQFYVVCYHTIVSFRS